MSDTDTKVNGSFRERMLGKRNDLFCSNQSRLMLRSGAASESPYFSAAHLYIRIHVIII